jgi:ABC-type polysaccharide/polyol phosphate export permease
VHAEYARAIDDIFAGARHWRMWARLGWQEVRRRYRRTVIGPFWTTLSLGIFVLSLSVVWAKLWNQSVATYLPFVSAGIITWTLVSALITDGCLTFVANEGLIKQLQISFTLLVISTVWRNVIVFFHNIAILAFVFVILRQPPGLALLLVVPGMFLLCINGAWMGLIFGMACARYRDLQQLIGSVLQVAIFVTPVFFMPSQLGGSRLYFVELNPLFHLIDIVRAPLLSTLPSGTTWGCVILLAVVGWSVTLVLFARFRRRVAFWL